MLPCADILLDDFLVAENSPYQPEMSSPVMTPERAPSITNTKANHSNVNPYVTVPALDGSAESLLSGGMGY